MTADRKDRLLIGLGIAAAILIGRLFVIQIIDTSYKIDASNNSMVYQTIYPTRGIIHDRNGKILVGNKITYDLIVTPKEVGEFDTLALCRVLGISEEFLREKMDGYYRDRRKIGYRSVTMLTHLPPEIFMKFAEVSYKFPGFRGQARNIRDYPYNAEVELINPVADTVANANYRGADVEWYIKADDIVLKNKGSQPTGNPQNHAPQGQQKK